MTINELPIITKVPVGSRNFKSGLFKLNNYGVILFIIETREDGADVIIKINGSGDGKEAKAVPFLLKQNGDAEFDEIPAEGATVKHSGEETIQWLAMITADMLSKPEFDGVTLDIDSSMNGAVKNICSLQMQPRYSDGGNE